MAIPVSKLHNVYDPRESGVTFDGATDDTAAWTRWNTKLHEVASAQNLAETGGIRVQCPPGVSLNGIAHNLPQRVSVEGAGHGTQLVSTEDGVGFFNMTGRYQHLRDLHFVAAMGSGACLLYTSPSPRDRTRSRMPSSA